MVASAQPNLSTPDAARCQLPRETRKIPECLHTAWWSMRKVLDIGMNVKSLGGSADRYLCYDNHFTGGRTCCRFSNKGGSVFFFFAGPLVMWHVIIGVTDSTLAMFRERRVVGVVAKRWITGNICHSK